MRNRKINKVSITIVGDHYPNELMFGGVLHVPEEFDLNLFPSYYRAYMQEILDEITEEDFTDWVVDKYGFTEDEEVGFVYLTPEDLEEDDHE
jgi:hypothetical protein